MTHAAESKSFDFAIEGSRYSRNQLSRYFDAVKNPINWKLEINAVVPAVAGERYLDTVNATLEAIEFFTGERMADIVTIPYRNSIWVFAKGYYAICGA